MALFLNEREVADLLPMDECIEVLDEAFSHAGKGQTELKPRSRMRMPGGFFHFMAAADAGHNVFGYKAYPSFGGPGGAKMLVMLYDYESGALLAIFQLPALSQRSPSLIRRAADISSPNAMSAVALANTPGVLPTNTPRRVASATSMLSTPTPS